MVELRPRGLSWLALLVVLACRSAAPMPRLESVPVRSPAEHPGDFQWQQTVTVRYGKQAPRSFDAVLEKSGAELRLVGVTPIGTVTFVAEAIGTEVRFENRTGEALPFDGSHILRDVQRVFFPWLHGPFVEGHRAGAHGGLTVKERREEGVLVERTFHDAEGLVATVRFQSPGEPPAKAQLESRLGYRLTLETTVVD